MAAAGSIGLASTAALAGTWKYGEDPRGHSELQTSRTADDLLYRLRPRLRASRPLSRQGQEKRTGCDHHRLRQGPHDLQGEFEETDAEMATEFLQWDLGFRRQDPSSMASAGRPCCRGCWTCSGRASP